MRRIVNIQKQLLPDLVDVMKKRYGILQHIMINGPVGRRLLAASMNMTERVLRGEVDVLKRQGLIEARSSGMRITEVGKNLLSEIYPFMKDLFGLTELEERIREHYSLEQVKIVPGDCDRSDYVKKELGLAGASALRKAVEREEIIAVTGGSTMAEVALHLSSSPYLKKSLFVPARGGLGESVEFQANTIASTMAKKVGGQYRLLHVPDHLGKEAYQTLIQEPNIREIVSVIRKSRIVVHGIGDALVMARRRKSDSATQQSLKEAGALAEAFGYYFDHSGSVVHKMQTVGLRLEDLQQLQTVVAVAGGKSKGEAIASIMKHGHEHVLITDEAAALEIVKQMF